MSRHHEYQGGAWAVGETTLHFAPQSDSPPDLLAFRAHVARLLAYARARAKNSKPYTQMIPVLEAELRAINARIEQPVRRRKVA